MRMNSFYLFFFSIKPAQNALAATRGSVSFAFADPSDADQRRDRALPRARPRLSHQSNRAASVDYRLSQSETDPCAARPADAPAPAAVGGAVFY